MSMLDDFINIEYNKCMHFTDNNTNHHRKRGERSQGVCEKISKTGWSFLNPIGQQELE